MRINPRGDSGMDFSEINEKIKDNEPEWESFFNDLTNGFAILQVRDDLPEQRDIRFCSYEQASGFLQREPRREDYNMLYAEAFENNEITEIVNLNARYDKSTALGDYIYERFNADSRPGIEEGYYGTSLSMSDVVLIKENNQIHALYVNSFGFKELEDFEPYKFISKDEKAYENDYRLLARLKADCEYFLDAGNGNEDKLWAKNIDEQISEMENIYDRLPVKPEWCTKAEIAEFGKEMRTLLFGRQEKNKHKSVTDISKD